MLALNNSKERYGLPAILLHWLMAVLIIGMLCLGLYMDSLPLGSDKLKLYSWHKEWGTVILALVVLRFLWKLTQISPLLPETMPSWQVHAAKAGHAALYLLMVAMPLTGWMMSSAAGFPVSVFGWFTLPNLVAPNDELRKILSETHEYLAFILMAMIAGHVGAVILHYLKKEPILQRMLPW